MAILLIAFSAIVAYLSAKMPSPRGWRTSPGLFPMLIATGLFLMALFLLIGAIKVKLSNMIKAVKSIDFFKLFRQKSTQRFGLITLAIFVYVYIMLRFLPFEIATIVYLMGTFLLFWKTKISKMLIVSILIPVCISILFTLVFKSLLPGGSLIWPLIKLIR